MALEGSHELSDEENKRLFNARISTLLLDQVACDLGSPRLILLGGQPGSGKSRLLRGPAFNEIKKNCGYPMVIDADDLRIHHPSWSKVNLESDTKAAEHTHSDARKWVRQACNLAITNKCNVILDGTMGSKVSIEAILTQFNEAGYDIEARVLAVDNETSWLGVLSRYEEQKHESGFGRMTPRKVHDEAYSGLVETLRTLEKDKRVRRIFVCGRGSSALFDSNSLVADQTKTAVAALETERDRSKTQEESEKYRSAVTMLLTKANNRGLSASTLDEYEKQIMEA